MEFVRHDDGSVTHIPDAIIAASKTELVERPHRDPQLAKAGVKTVHHRRSGVEAYLAASPAQRDVLLAAAKAEVDPKPAPEVEASASAPSPAIAGAESE